MPTLDPPTNAAPRTYSCPQGHQHLTVMCAIACEDGAPLAPLDRETPFMCGQGHRHATEAAHRACVGHTIWGFTIVDAAGEPSRFYVSRASVERDAKASGGQAIRAMRHSKRPAGFGWQAPDASAAKFMVATGERTDAVMPSLVWLGDTDVEVAAIEARAIHGVPERAIARVESTLPADFAGGPHAILLRMQVEAKAPSRPRTFTRRARPSRQKVAA